MVISKGLLMKGIVIAGPTGIGKTDLAVELAKKLNGELISCDSVQVYKDLQIGANKTPTPVPQHLLDLVHWREPFTAADFLEHYNYCIKDLVKRGKVPILVGGTGFYLDWILSGRPTAPATDQAVLKEIEKDLKKDENWETSFARLSSVDPDYSKVITPNDYYRLKRALSVYRQTGMPLSSFKSRNLDGNLVDWRCFYLTHTDRESLLRHIDNRCEKMIERGLVRETLELKKKGFNNESQAGRAIGYMETLRFLTIVKEASMDQREKLFQEYVKDFQSQTRQYTRKQEKWFYGKPEFLWVERESLSQDLSESLIERVCEYYQMDRQEFDKIRSEDPLRHQCKTPINIQERRKKLRTYRSNLCIFNDHVKINSILELIDDYNGQPN